MYINTHIPTHYDTRISTYIIICQDIMLCRIISYDWWWQENTPCIYLLYHFKLWWYIYVYVYIYRHIYTNPTSDFISLYNCCCYPGQNNATHNQGSTPGMIPGRFCIQTSNHFFGLVEEVSTQLIVRHLGHVRRTRSWIPRPSDTRRQWN